MRTPCLFSLPLLMLVVPVELKLSLPAALVVYAVLVIAVLLAALMIPIVCFV